VLKDLLSLPLVSQLVNVTSQYDLLPISSCVCAGPAVNSTREATESMLPFDKGSKVGHPTLCSSKFQL